MNSSKPHEPMAPSSESSLGPGLPVVMFYRASERPYGAFSNLLRRDIKILGRSFPTVEHAYQWLKPRDPRVRDWLMAAPAPSSRWSRQR